MAQFSGEYLEFDIAIIKEELEKLPQNPLVLNALDNVIKGIKKYNKVYCSNINDASKKELRKQLIQTLEWEEQYKRHSKYYERQMKEQQQINSELATLNNEIREQNKTLTEQLAKYENYENGFEA